MANTDVEHKVNMFFPVWEASDKEGNYLNVIGPYMIYEKLTAHILNGGKLKAFPKIRNKVMMPICTTFVKQSTRNPSQSNQLRKRNKNYPNLKGRSKISFVYKSCNLICKKNPSNCNKNVRSNKLI